jgi:hypothetical protein
MTHYNISTGSFAVMHNRYYGSKPPAWRSTGGIDDLQLAYGDLGIVGRLTGAH